MARRVSLPDHIRATLPDRANAGAGHHPDHPTTFGERTVRADLARQLPPSQEMLTMVQDVVAFLNRHNAEHIDVCVDLRGTEPGAILVRWNGGVPALTVAERFAVDTVAGTPRIPSWLSLCADHEFDLRWQPPY